MHNSFPISMYIVSYQNSEMKQKSKLNTIVICYLLKNSLAVKKGAALFKMASMKKVVKSKGAAKKWL